MYQTYPDKSLLFLHHNLCIWLCLPDKHWNLHDPEIPSWKEKAQLAVAGKEWVDCNALGVSKWTAISFLMEKYQLNADEICCFGDNLNDIEMLKNAGTSYAVSNARPEVIEAAKSTCAPYWESGVLEVLKSFL